jgi:nicotinamidase/pyrazinamidase
MCETEPMPDELRPGDALIIVDVQNDFCPGGSLAVEGGDQVVPILNRWIHQAADLGIPIFFSRDWHPLNHVSFKERGGPWPPHCVQNTRGAELHPGLFVPESAVIVSKADTKDEDSYSAFGGTSLADHLKKLGIRRVWIGGLALDYCVSASALDARALGLDVRVLMDATRAVHNSSEEVSRSAGKLESDGVRLVRQA